jgi:hypothetical protein
MRDAEFQLLVAACNASIHDRPIDARPQDIRWERLFQLASRHRVQALCWNALSPFSEDLPEDIAAELQAQSRDIVVANLRTAAECRRLQQSFETAGLPLLFLKGLTLAALAYRNPYLKMGIDIDLLVEPERLDEAAHRLRLAGYDPVTPSRSTERDLKRWHATHKESVWYRREGGFQIDLHTRLADHPTLLQDMTAASPSQQVAVATGIALPTLTGDDLFAYLCVHGASSAWFRLKWISDLAALLRDKEEKEIERLYQHAEQAGAGRAAGQALLLADRLYSVRLGEDLRSRLEGQPAIAWLVRAAESQLLAGTEPTERFLGTAVIHISQLGLRPGWRFKASEAVRQIRDMLGLDTP